ncbi:MAG: hypothetical protein N2249_03525 [Melioribacter sp.]|nr:hypothetical protein [Melioribacter sp.]
MKSYVKFILLFIFGIAMANVEAAIVVYLRKLYYPEGFKFPLKTIPLEIIKVELIREISTLVMLLSIAYLCANKAIERFFYFIYVFAIWDIFYYIWLKVFLNWPSTLFDDDILFLIPVPWIAPVIAPIIISFCMIIFSFVTIYLKEKGFVIKLNKTSTLLALLGVIFILYSFMYDFSNRINSTSPVKFLYEIFFGGLVLILISFWYFIKKFSKRM